MTLPTSLRALTAPAAATVAALALASPATANHALDIRVTDDAVKVQGAGDLGRGPLGLRFRRDGDDARSVAVVELDRGRTKADVDRIPLGGLADARRVEAIGRLVGGTTLQPDERAELTIDARARRYVVVDLTTEAQNSASFKVRPGDHGSDAPATQGRVTLRDDGIGLSSFLPRDGAIRIANRGKRPHHALAVLLRESVTTDQARRALRAGKPPTTLGTPIELSGLLSGGTAVTVRRFLPEGRYVVASLYAGRGARPDVARGLVGATRIR